MKTLNKHNLAIAKLAPSEENRYALSSIYVTPECTVETDGHQLMIVTTAETNTLPTIEDMVPAETFEPFLLPRGIALKMATELPSVIQAQTFRASKKKKKAVTKPKRRVIVSQKAGESSLAVGDGDGDSTLFNFRKREGAFPNYELVLPDKEKTKFQVTLDPKILLGIAQQFASFGGCAVIRFEAEDKPIRIDAHNSKTSQRMTAVIMPMRNDDKSI